MGSAGDALLRIIASIGQSCACGTALEIRRNSCMTWPHNRRHWLIADETWARNCVPDVGIGTNVKYSVPFQSLGPEPSASLFLPIDLV